LQADVAMAKMVDGKIQEVFLQMFLQTNPLIKRIESTRLPTEPRLTHSEIHHHFFPVKFKNWDLGLEAGIRDFFQS